VTRLASSAPPVVTPLRLITRPFASQRAPVTCTPLGTVTAAAIVALAFSAAAVIDVMSGTARVGTSGNRTCPGSCRSRPA
jgi:hypothetical protein